MPGELVLVPHHPKEAQEKSPGREHVAGTAQQHLPGRGRFPGEADDLQSSQHHSRSRATEGGEERKILQIDNGESRDVHRGAQLAQSELAAERAEEHQESTVGKQQAEEIEESREASIVKRSQRMKTGQ